MQNNYKFLVRYDGTRFLGWEHQPGKEWTIQGKLETVLTRMLEEEAEKNGKNLSSVKRGVNDTLVTVIVSGTYRRRGSCRCHDSQCNSGQS